MGTKREHLLLPENASHEGWRKEGRTGSPDPRAGRHGERGRWREVGSRTMGLGDEGEQGHGGAGAAGTGLFTGWQW